MQSQLRYAGVLIAIGVSFTAPPVVCSGQAPISASTDSRTSAMPSSATISFSVKGWLASGVRVDSLLVDAKKSRGLGSGVTPYKGVKYLTVSRKGVEVRC